jgi:hypothetical protein
MLERIEFALVGRTSLVSLAQTVHNKCDHFRFVDEQAQKRVATEVIESI